MSTYNVYRLENASNKYIKELGKITATGFEEKHLVIICPVLN